MNFQGVGHSLEDVASQLDGHHLRGGKDGVELGEVGGGDGEGECGAVEVGAGKGDARVDQLAAVGLQVRGVPVHAHQEVGVSGEGGGDREADEVEGGGAFGVGEELDVTYRRQGLRAGKKAHNEQNCLLILLHVIKYHSLDCF